jgi:hypothetical protein
MSDALEDQPDYPRATAHLRGAGPLMHSTRIQWDGGTGVAALHGCYRRLSAPPMAFRDAYWIDYAPAAGVAQIWRRGEVVRDMNEAEKHIAKAYLRDLFPSAGLRHVNARTSGPHRSTAQGATADDA